MASTTKLRVGLLLNGLKVPAWAHAMLKQIVSSDYAEIALIVTDNSRLKEEIGLIERARQSPASLAQTALHHGLSTLLWRAAYSCQADSDPVV